MTRHTLEGVADLTKQLEALGKLGDGKALRSAVRNGIKPAFDRAQQLIPVGTEPHRTYRGLLVAPGFAETQIRRATTLNAEKNIASAVLTTTKEGYYAVNFVEVGTRYQQAQPWLRRGFSETRDQCEEKLRASLQKSVLRAVKLEQEPDQSDA